jgi:hypothetical protein
VIIGHYLIASKIDAEVETLRARFPGIRTGPL